MFAEELFRFVHSNVRVLQVLHNGMWQPTRFPLLRFTTTDKVLGSMVSTQDSLGNTKHSARKVIINTITITIKNQPVVTIRIITNKKQLFTNKLVHLLESGRSISHICQCLFLPTQKQGQRLNLRCDCHLGGKIVPKWIYW